MYKCSISEYSQKRQGGLITLFHPKHKEMGETKWIYQVGEVGKASLRPKRVDFDKIQEKKEINSISSGILPTLVTW